VRSRARRSSTLTRERTVVVGRRSGAVLPRSCETCVRSPHGLISITSIRPARARVEQILDLRRLARRRSPRRNQTDLVNLGHIVTWGARSQDSVRRRTVHFPNAYDDITRLLSACATHGIDRSWASWTSDSSVTRLFCETTGLLPDHPWFLIELDSSSLWLGGTGRTIHGGQLRRH
jgi:hypothetical protein